ncbi:MAG: exonuclease [Nitrososphaerota archaeon]|nr:exonuclease [Nitrososphaerota archaeon]
MVRIDVKYEGGIIVEHGSFKVMLDPIRAPSNRIIFISHAHVDHIPNSANNGCIITSNETAFLARVRGIDLGNTKEGLDGLELIDSGHILGARGLLIGGDVFYTGDIAGRARGFLPKGKGVKCKVLIIESTYGKEGFIFPPLVKILDEVNRLIADLFSKGVPVVLMGYPLGKAQILSYLFSNWDPIYVHGSIERMNRAYIDLGVKLPDKFRSYSEAMEKGWLSRKPWVLIAPLYSGRSNFIRRLKKDFGAVTIAFTGWSIIPQYRYAMMVDHAYPLSDHCDLEELIGIVKECDPEKVYTTHGFSSELATYLRRLGFDAEPLLNFQRSITDYAKDE